MKKNIRNILQLNKIIFKNAKVQYLVFLLQKIIDGILPSIQVIIIAQFVDYVIEISNGKKAIFSIFNIGLVLLIILIIQYFMPKVVSLMETKMIMKLRETYHVKIVEDITQLKYRYIEDKDTKNLIERVLDHCEEKLTYGYEGFLAVISTVIRICGISIIVMCQEIWIGTLILLLTIPGIYLAIKNGKVTYEANQEATDSRRKYKYLEDVLLNRNHVEERIIFDNFNFFEDQWSTAYDCSRKIEIRAFLKYFLKIRLSAVLQTVIMIVILIFLAVPLYHGNMTVGFYMAITGNIISVFQLQNQQLAYSLKELVHTAKYMEEYQQFATLEKTKIENNKACIDINNICIEFRNVRFRYPGNDIYTLKGVTFCIEAGKKYAFVGENGCGKTTVIKLMTGMYDDFEGEILINGVSIRKYGIDDIRKIYSVVYQDFAKYQISVKDNILLGNAENITKEANIRKLLQDVDLYEDICALPQKENTVLGKIKENSVDLSLGQWQKIAIARAFSSQSPIRIMDEPTASLDPISEYGFYQKCQKLSEKFTTILVSHRLASVKSADEILVFGDGIIKEMGTHEELMEKNGIYAIMYESQRKWYEEK